MRFSFFLTKNYHKYWLFLVIIFGIGFPILAENDALKREVESDLPFLFELYKTLHAQPELSLEEHKTAARLAHELRTLDFEVTESVGGTGIVGILKSGDGPVVMLRTDLDALPITETTELPYASQVVVTDESGRPTGVMHACGHDLHMTAFIGAARWLASNRSAWSGTLMFVGQPAEERGLGAKAMLEDGLFERFPKPDYVLGLHTAPMVPAGQVGVVSGYALASVDSVDIKIYGVGSHGAAPHLSVDPIVIGARLVGALQTIVSREIDPLKSAVVTVGSFHAGTKHNIIPEVAELQLTVRAYDPEVRKHILKAIKRLAESEAAAAGAPKPPEVTVKEGTPVTTNDEALVARVRPAFEKQLGQAAVVDVERVMAGEDFSRYGLEGIPAFIYWVGGPAEEKFKAAQEGLAPLPSLHRSDFAPDPEPSIVMGVRAHLAAILELISSP